jgi:DNA-directed RNA polymerase subunit RPC12/RpoP
MFPNGKKDQPCLNCGAVLLSTALDEAGHISANTLTKFVFEEVTDDLYIKCQKCGAKNCAELVTGPDGSPRVRINHVRPE